MTFIIIFIFLHKNEMTNVAHGGKYHSNREIHTMIKVKYIIFKVQTNGDVLYSTHLTS